jgi:uncharacterized protein YdaU (DUF1376 family)
MTDDLPPYIPWYKYYPDTELARTASLSLEEKAIYRELKDLIWVNRGELVDDDEKLARLLRISKRKWLPIKKNIAHLFQFFNGKVSDSTLTRARVEAELKREKKVKSGQLGGRKRAENLEMLQANATTNAEANGQVMLKPTSTSTRLQSNISKTAIHSREREKKLSTDLSTFLSTNNLDANNPEDCQVILGFMLKRVLKPKERGIVRGWCDKFEMERVLSLLEPRIPIFEADNEGRSPPLKYFIKMLDDNATYLPEKQIETTEALKDLQRELADKFRLQKRDSDHLTTQ